MKNLGSLVHTKRRKTLLVSIMLLAICIPAAYATSSLIYYSNIVHIHGGGPKQYSIDLVVTDPLPYGTVDLQATVTPIPLYPPGAPVSFYFSNDTLGYTNGAKVWYPIVIGQSTANNGKTSKDFNLTGLATYDFKATVNGTVTISGITTPTNILYTSNFVRASFAGYAVNLVVGLADDGINMNFNATVTSTDTPARSVTGLTVNFVTSIDSDVTWQSIGTGTTDSTGFATLHVLLTDLPSGDYDAQATVQAPIIIEPTPA